jgi:four helix bundle protein
MSNITPKKFDLEERTFRFASKVRTCLATLPSSTTFVEDKKQLIRSSGSVAANYMEANEAISRKDFVLRIKICRKEARESHMWLRLIREGVDTTQHAPLDFLIDESLQLVKIFNAIAYRVRQSTEEA